MRTRFLLPALLLLLTASAGVSAKEEAPDPDARAKELYQQYLLERKEKTWGAFQRRLTALRQLGPVSCPRARKSLLKVAKSGRTLDDRILAAEGLARYGDVEAVQDLLALLARKGHPVLTQVVGEALADTKVGEVIAWLSSEALALEERELAPVLRAHAELPTPEAAARLLALYEELAASDRTVDAAYDVVEALGRGAAAEARPALLAASQHDDFRLRLAAADVLPLQDVAEADVLAAVKRLLQDPEARVKRAAARSIGAAEREALLPNVADLLTDEDPRTRKCALDVLKRATKQDLGFDAGAWRRWLATRGTPEAVQPYTVPSYHGLPIFTENVVFILDRSGSMLWPFVNTETSRMEVAQHELVRVLDELSPRTHFNVLSFDSKVFTWRKGETEATEKAVSSAGRWVEKQEAERGAFTNTYGVLETAYAENPRIDTIYLLSDGIPEDGEITTSEGLLAAVRDWNRYRRVQIHAIALTLMYTHPGKYPITSSMRRAEAFMRNLARIGGGSFQHVDRPPK